MATTETTPLQITIRPPATQATPAQAFWSSDAPAFKDVLNTVNPLQHIPVVSSFYQSATGDVPSVGSKLLGGALFGGPVGFLASLFDTILQNATGKDITGNIVAAVTGTDAPYQVADNTPLDHVNASQRTAYNAYLQSQSLLA